MHDFPRLRLIGQIILHAMPICVNPLNQLNHANTFLVSRRRLDPFKKRPTRITWHYPLFRRPLFHRPSFQGSSEATRAPKPAPPPARQLVTPQAAVSPKRLEPAWQGRLLSFDP